MHKKIYNEEKKNLEMTIKKIEELKELNRHNLKKRKKSENEILKNINYPFNKELANIKNLNMDINIEESPYFARIDFREEGTKEDEVVYIGIRDVKDDCYNFFIYDWRSNIASMYYDYPVGECEFKTPNNQIIKGQLNLKRQIDIENGKIVRIFNSNMHVNDQILKHMLSEGTSSSMKNIITTIQREQNKIIRSTAKNILIDGCAGSGKTSVALHRVAMQLYLSKTLENYETLIICPNKLFSKYILGVFPSISEKYVFQSNLTNLIEQIIPECEIVSNALVVTEMLYTNEYIPTDKPFKNYKLKKNLQEGKVLKFKLSKKLHRIIDKYLDYILDNIIPEDIVFNTNFYITKKEINDFRKNMLLDFPVIDQIRGIIDRAKFLLKRIPDLNFIKEQTKILNNIQIKDTFSLYKDMFLNNKLLYKLTENKEDYEILAAHYTDVISGRLRYEDIDSYLYFKIKYEELEKNNRIKLIVIDEIMDYTETQLRYIKETFPKANFILLGDKRQGILHNTSYDDIFEIFDLEYFELKKCFRNTKQINQYSNGILGDYTECINRDGEEIKVIKSDPDKLNENVINYSINNKKGITAIVVKTLKELEDFKKICMDTNRNFNYITNGKYQLQTGINVVPSYLLKGVDVDSVVVLNLNSYSDNEKNLLYMVCTRAKHKLTLFTSNFY